MSSSSPVSISPPAGSEKKHWWMTNRKVAEKYVKDARLLLATQDQAQKMASLVLLDAALALYPSWETPLQLKATALLHLRRYKDITELFREEVPSVRHSDELLPSSTTTSSSSLSLENLLPQPAATGLTRCFSVSDFKRCLLERKLGNSGKRKNQHWRYIVLGQACSHLGLLEDSVILLQAGKRLASAASRRDSGSFNDDLFLPSMVESNLEFEGVNQIISNAKFLLRRRAAALAALEAGMAVEAVRHFSKILESTRRSVPQAFLAECYMHRAAAYQAAGRIPEAIADCNRSLALEPTSVGALSTRAALMERVRCFSECLQDLEHLKLLYDSILRDRRVRGPAWKRGAKSFRDIPAKSRNVSAKVAELKKTLVEPTSVDYYALLGLRRGCGRSELERVHRLLCLRHQPDRSMVFVDRCEFADERDEEAVRDQARMSGVLLYRLLQKAYSNVMANIMEDEAIERQKQRMAENAAAPPAAMSAAVSAVKRIGMEIMVEDDYASIVDRLVERRKDFSKGEFPEKAPPVVLTTGGVFSGGFCREIGGVGSLLSPGFNIPEALSC